MKYYKIPILLSIFINSYNPISFEEEVKKDPVTNQALVSGYEDDFLQEQISIHTGASSSGRLAGMSMSSFSLDSVTITENDSVILYTMRFDKNPDDINFGNYVLKYQDGMVYATLIEFYPEIEWYYKKGRKKNRRVNWSKFTGQIVISDLNSDFTDEIQVKNGKK